VCACPFIPHPMALTCLLREVSFHEVVKFYGSKFLQDAVRAWARESRVHTYLLFLLLLTDLPLDCVAPRVGTLGTFRCRTQAISLDSVLTVNTAPTPSQSDEDGF
jgi:hypothetical protein